MTLPEAAALNSAERTASAFNEPVRGRLMCESERNKRRFRRPRAKTLHHVVQDSGVQSPAGGPAQTRPLRLYWSGFLDIALCLATTTTTGNAVKSVTEKADVGVAFQGPFRKRTL